MSASTRHSTRLRLSFPPLYVSVLQVITTQSSEPLSDLNKTFMALASDPFQAAFVASCVIPILTDLLAQQHRRSLTQISMSEMAEQVQALVEADQIEIQGCRDQISALEDLLTAKEEEVRNYDAQLSACNHELNQCKSQINQLSAGAHYQALADCQAELERCQSDLQAWKGYYEYCYAEKDTLAQRVRELETASSGVAR